MNKKQLLRLIAFNLVLLFVLMETTGLLAYRWRTGEIYYLNPPRGRQMPEEPEGQAEGFRIHPYFGFIVRPSLGPEVAGPRYNNYGFISALDYPYPRRLANKHPAKDELQIGIYGGSAASYLAQFEVRERVLSRHLAAALGRPLEGIQVLNFAQGGFKQPQQLLIDQYFATLGQELDVVINFDGFNEVALGASNVQAGVEIAMPSIEHTAALREATSMSSSSEGLERRLRVRQHWARFSRMFNRAWGGEAWELHFASGFMVDWLIYRYHRSRYQNGRQALLSGEGSTDAAAGSWFHLNESSSTGSPEGALTADLVQLWARSSEALAAAVHYRGGRYFHFVQPNQYHDTKRVYGEQERRLAFNRLSPYIETVKRGYPQLATEIPALRRRGVAVEGLFELLDELEVAAYVDDCCHFTDAAQRVLLLHMAEVVVDELLNDGTSADRRE